MAYFDDFTGHLKNEILLRVRSFQYTWSLLLPISLISASFQAGLRLTYIQTNIPSQTIGVGWESRSLTRRRWTQSYGLVFMRDRLECGFFIRDFCRERSELTKITLIWNSVFIAFVDELGGRSVSSAVLGHHLAEPNGGFRSWASVISDVCINIFSFWPFHTIVVKYAHFGITVQNKD